MAIFSIWEGDDMIGITLKRGEGPPTHSNGEPMDPNALLVITFKAASWEEACQAQNDHYGWGKYLCEEGWWEKIGPDEE